MKKALFIAAAALAMTGFVSSANAGTLSKCKNCHHLDSTKKKVGPGLKGVFGRHAGAVEGFHYKYTKYGSDWVWDEEHLAKWVCNSKKAVKEFTGDAHAKTKMPPQKKCGDAAKEVIEALKAL